MSVLAVVPARGGSKRVRRKNMRRVGATPLLLRTLQTARAAGVFCDVVVSTDDEEIAAFARLRKYPVVMRDSSLSNDDATVFDVARDVALKLEHSGHVALLQPTSPFLTVETVQKVASAAIEVQTDVLATATRNKHLLWSERGPLFDVFANSQHQKGVLQATGGLYIYSPETIASGSLERKSFGFFEVDEREAIDIDTMHDLQLAQGLARSHTVLFLVAATRDIGSGHVRRCIQIADEMPGNKCFFTSSKGVDAWAVQMIEDAGYTYLKDSFTAVFDAVVVDHLDTTTQEIAALMASGSVVVTLEDLGPGSSLATTTVNELYSKGDKSGPRYAVIRSEFVDLRRRTYIARERPRIGVSFGGTDPSDLTYRIGSILSSMHVDVRIARPPARSDSYPFDVETPTSMAEVMRWSDLFITSTGRTVYEAAACGTPTLSLPANSRERAHLHLPGVTYWMTHELLSDRELATNIYAHLADTISLARNARKAQRQVDCKGALRIANLINNLVEDLL